MRYLSIALFILFPTLVAASEPWTPRPLDDIATETFALALESPTVRQLVATLETSNVIVHIVSSRELPPGVGGTTRFVATRGGYRYLRITIAAELARSTRAAILGHELQHACEVARSTADDVESLRKLFEEMGTRDGNTFDTPAARRIEKIVWNELQ